MTAIIDLTDGAPCDFATSTDEASDLVDLLASLASGPIRIMCGDEVVYEGPLGSWPPVRPARPLPMCDGGEMVMATDVSAWLRGGTAGERAFP